MVHVLAPRFAAAVCAVALLLALAPVRGDEPATITTLDQATAAAQKSRRPILAIVGGESCPYCRLLEMELQHDDAQRELARWTLATLDVDQAANDAQALGVRAIPALRVLTPAGKVVAAREGAMSAADLVAWLQEHFSGAGGALSPELTAQGELTGLAAIKLVRELGRRDATAREAAIRRLLPHADLAAAPVASAFAEGSLATRLSALELLAAWKAPVAGLDPWQPETITRERLEALSAWSADPTKIDPSVTVAELSETLRSTVADSIRQMLTASPAEAAVYRERLARHGKLILPAVYERLREAESDEDRARLTALRYRLVATDELALGWAGGIDRLAAADAAERHLAMVELARRATASDEPLLLELFSDPEPLVRELALEALYKAGGAKANGALVRLLGDPDPNVQAAVLKQLAETPARAVVPRIAEYVAKQPDTDLVVHAVRVLRTAQGKAAVECLIGLLAHESWRVRAEAAEAIGEAAGDYNVPDEDKADAYVALVEALGDEDSFVVSRAVQVLGKARLATAVAPLAEVAARHPALAVEVVQALAHSSAAQLKVAEHLRKFAGHENPGVRAAAVKGLCELNPENLEPELSAALADAAPPVRLAAAEGLFQLMTSEFALQESLASGDSASVPTTPAEIVAQGVDKLLDLFSKRKTPVDEQPAEAAAPSVAADAALDQAVPLPDWMQQLEEPLRKMLTSDNADERLAAALPLVALGRTAEALPVLEREVQDDRRHATVVAGALRWLLWDQRQKLFALLLEAARGSDDVGAVAYSMAQRRHPDVAASLWDVLARPGVDGPLTAKIASSLTQLYVGEHSYNLEAIPKQQREAAVAEARKRAADGSRWQRLAALSLLASLDLSAAAEVAGQLADASPQDHGLAASAFQVLLYTAETDVADKAAVAALQEPEPGRQSIALTYLALGKEPLQSLEGEGLELSATPLIEVQTGGNRTPIPEPPEGLVADLLRPQLASDDARQRALAGYLLCLIGESEGLPPLLDYWNEAGRGDAQLMRLVYRALAALDDAARVSLLAEIYDRLASGQQPDQSEIAAFYWTIRGMTGAEVLALRKRIRDEVGIETLQRHNPFGEAFSTSRF
jgi:HEAT repeat protein